MSEKHVVIATFSKPMEAHVACGRLQAEGIPAHITGDVASTLFAGFGAVGGRVELYVPESACERALDILAECMPEEQWRVMFGKDSLPSQADLAKWTAEERIKRGVGPENDREMPLWVCSLCGDAVSVAETVCPACGTSREAIRPATREDLAEQQPIERGSDANVQAEEPVPSSPSLHSSLEVAEIDKYHQGDRLARRALLSAVVAFLSIPVAIFIGPWIGGVVHGVFFLIALFFLVRLMFYSGEMSPRAVRQCYVALALDLLLLGYKLLFSCVINAR